MHLDLRHTNFFKVSFRGSCKVQATVLDPRSQALPLRQSQYSCKMTLYTNVKQSEKQHMFYRSVSRLSPLSHPTAAAYRIELEEVSRVTLSPVLSFNTSKL